MRQRQRVRARSANWLFHRRVCRVVCEVTVRWQIARVLISDLAVVLLLLMLVLLQISHDGLARWSATIAALLQGIGRSGERPGVFLGIMRLLLRGLEKCELLRFTDLGPTAAIVVVVDAHVARIGAALDAKVDLIDGCYGRRILPRKSNSLLLCAVEAVG